MPKRFVAGHENRLRTRLTTEAMADPNPTGFCLCGCGERTRVARQSQTERGWVKGRPIPYAPGHYQPMRYAENVAKMRQAHLDKLAADPTLHINHRMARSHLRSGIERRMQNALRSIGIISLHGQRIGRRWPDLTIPEACLVIECDGTYWHNPDTDALRDQELNVAGWTVLHFTNDEIGKDVSACAQAVAAWLRDHGWSNPN